MVAEGLGGGIITSIHDCFKERHKAFFGTTTKPNHFISPQPNDNSGDTLGNGVMSPILI